MRFAGFAISELRTGSGNYAAPSAVLEIVNFASSIGWRDLIFYRLTLFGY